MKMKQCAFLSMDNLDGFEHYDGLVKSPLAELGWKVEEVSWRNPSADWSSYDVVVIRTPWDYHNDAENFLKVLETIDRSGVRLENPLELIRWNIDKTYLRDLEEQGVPIVPSIWGGEGEELARELLRDYFTQFNTGEIVIKPAISAGADDTYWLTKQGAEELFDELSEVFSNRRWMVQPFMKSVTGEGEYSLIYFGQEYSHALLKTPLGSDFRVQEEHGGILKRVEPEELLKNISDHIVETVQPTPLYSRVDMVRTDEGFALMELELIEPSLYFNMDPESPERFARFFNRWMEDLGMSNE